jgi:hypothetical protein
MSDPSGRETSGNVIPLAWATRRQIEIAVDGETLALVRRLRVLLRECQLSPRIDFDRACSLIAGDVTTTTERYAAAFFQGLQLFATRRLRFFPAKADAVSEDEMWLARLLQALNADDFATAKYLMALRVVGKGHRRLLFLAEKLAQILRPAHMEADDLRAVLQGGGQ